MTSERAHVQRCFSLHSLSARGPWQTTTHGCTVHGEAAAASDSESPCLFYDKHRSFRRTVVFQACLLCCYRCEVPSRPSELSATSTLWSGSRLWLRFKKKEREKGRKKKNGFRSLATAVSPTVVVVCYPRLADVPSRRHVCSSVQKKEKKRRTTRSFLVARQLITKKLINREL